MGLPTNSNMLTYTLEGVRVDMTHIVLGKDGVNTKLVRKMFGTR